VEHPAPSQVVAAVALGSNLGDRKAHLSIALAYMGVLPSTKVSASSSIHETAPVGPQDQGPFLNMAALLTTSLPPRQLLEALLAIEKACGRERTERWGPRTLDLDILLYGDSIIDEPGLYIPHPHMTSRHFVLAPLAEIMPYGVIPTTGQTVTQALRALGYEPDL
jgi:2-amino-4-hydroxy-6-hydroxymethyldihydropteridine diphosphokinase